MVYCCHMNYTFDSQVYYLCVSQPPSKKDDMINGITTKGKEKYQSTSPRLRGASLLVLQIEKHM